MVTRTAVLATNVWWKTAGDRDPRQDPAAPSIASFAEHGVVERHAHRPPTWVSIDLLAGPAESGKRRSALDPGRAQLCPPP